MSLSDVLSAIDSEISRLEHARAQLSKMDDRRTRSVKSVAKSSSKGKGRQKRVLSAEARERIAAAQRQRWAAQKKA